MSHILLITSYYPTVKKPTRAIYCREIALALARTGHRVGVLAIPELRFWAKGLRSFFFLWYVLRGRYTIENDQGIATYRHHVSLPFHWAKISGFLTSHWGDQLFQIYCNEHNQPDIIHAHFAFYSGVLGAHLKCKYKIPVVLTEHHSQIQLKKLNTNQKRALCLLSKNIDKIVAVGPQLAMSLRELVPDREIQIVGNFVDPARFSANYRKLPENPFIFTIVCNLYSAKGVDVLIDAFCKAFKYEDVILWICGDGPERKKLQIQAKNKGLNGRAFFLGKLSHGQVARRIQESHVVVCSSHIETFGIPLIEAMACGKPVVSTKCGGPEHFIEKSNGFLVPPGDAVSLAQALLKIRREYHSYSRKKIRADCLKRFGIDNVIEQYENIYKEAINADTRLQHDP
jgi:glycosyltransferase involved in cell wall biosynthesis